MSAGSMDLRNNWQLIFAFLFGVVFLGAIFFVAVQNPQLGDFAYTMLRIIVALAAAGIGAVLPGFLNVGFKGVLRAGGALALFVIVYFFPPVSPTPVIVPVVEPKYDAKATTDAWLSLVDNGSYGESYKVMAKAAFKDKYSYEEFVSVLTPIRKSLGEVKSRSYYSSQSYESPPGFSKGAYREYIYKSSYTALEDPVYEFVSLVGEKDKWRVFGFRYAQMNSFGQFIPIKN